MRAPFVSRATHERLLRYVAELEQRCLLLREMELRAHAITGANVRDKAYDEELDWQRRTSMRVTEAQARRAAASE